MLAGERALSSKSTSEGLASRAHLLIVDDDARIRSMLSRYFGNEGFRISLAESGAQMQQRLAECAIDLILLDLGLPDVDGLSLARDVRAQSDLGIIILTGRGDDVDRIVGLEVGADDYIAKPFNLREVLARVKSVLRRLQPAATSLSGKSSPASIILQFEGWQLDKSRRELMSPERREVPLTTGEYDLLSVFLEHAGHVLTRDYLMDQTRGRTWEAFDRTIDAQVSRLRRKIEGDVQNPRLLKSVRGVGYVFTARVSQN